MQLFYARMTRPLKSRECEQVNMIKGPFSSSLFVLIRQALADSFIALNGRHRLPRSPQRLKSVPDAREFTFIEARLR
jgi:hypothetical protein